MKNVRKRSFFGDFGIVVAALVAMSGLSGCIVAGYSSRGGLFFWPGSLGLTVVVLLVLWLLRRGR